MSNLRYHKIRTSKLSTDLAYWISIIRDQMVKMVFRLPDNVCCTEIFIQSFTKKKLPHNGTKISTTESNTFSNLVLIVVISSKFKKRNSTQTRLWALSISSLLVWPFTKYFNKTNRVSIFHVIIDSVCSDLTGVYVIEFGLISFKFIHTQKLRSGGMAVVVTGWQPGSGNTNSMRIVKIP